MMKRKVIFWCLFILFVGIFVSASALRYMYLNASGYEISERTCQFEREVAMGKLTYRVGEPRVEKVYSKSYGDEVLRYFVPFQAENKKTDSLVKQKVAIDHLVIVSGGRKWEVDPFASKKLKVNQGIKWVLQPGEKTSGEMLIEIPIDKKGEGYYTADILKKYQLYFVERHKRGADKYKFQN